MKKFQFLILPFLFFCLSAFSQTELNKLNELTSFIEKGMADWEIPGLSVSVVKNGKTIYQKGFGLKNINLIHTNDSKKPLGSRVDRHAHIGQGCFGIESLRAFVMHPKLANLPLILETPKEKNGYQGA